MVIFNEARSLETLKCFYNAPMDVFVFSCTGKKITIQYAAPEQIAMIFRKAQVKDEHTIPKSAREKTYIEMVNAVIDGSDTTNYIWSNYVDIFFEACEELRQSRIGKKVEPKLIESNFIKEAKKIINRKITPQIQKVVNKVLAMEKSGNYDGLTEEEFSHVQVAIEEFTSGVLDIWVQNWKAAQWLQKNHFPMVFKKNKYFMKYHQFYNPFSGYIKDGLLAGMLLSFWPIWAGKKTFNAKYSPDYFTRLFAKHFKYPDEKRAVEYFEDMYDLIQDKNEELLLTIKAVPNLGKTEDLPEYIKGNKMRTSLSEYGYVDDNVTDQHYPYFDSFDKFFSWFQDNKITVSGYGIIRHKQFAISEIGEKFLIRVGNGGFILSGRNKSIRLAIADIAYIKTSYKAIEFELKSGGFFKLSTNF